MRPFLYLYFLNCLLVFLIPSCLSEKPTALPSPPPQPPQGITLLIEAESSRIIEAEVVSDRAAFSGQAVRLLSSRSFCSQDFFLREGTFIARARVKATSPGGAQLYLSIGSQTVLLQPASYGSFVYCPQLIEFRLTRPAPGFIQFAAFASGYPPIETTMLIDAIEIWEKDTFYALNQAN